LHIGAQGCGKERLLIAINLLL